MFFSDKCIKTLEGEANIALSRLQDWFIANKLTLNVEKTCFSLLSNKRSIPNLTLTLNDQKVDKVHIARYLGMYLDDNLNWAHHVDYIVNKLVKLKGAFYYRANVLNKDCIRQVYYAYVFPYL